MSGSSNSIPDTVRACGTVVGGVGQAMRGAVVSVLGTGIYLLTLDREYDPTSLAMFAHITTGGGGEIGIAPQGADEVRVSTFNALGAAADRDFCFLLVHP